MSACPLMDVGVSARQGQYGRRTLHLRMSIGPDDEFLSRS
jgi:hypothetical protein